MSSFRKLQPRLFTCHHSKSLSIFYHSKQVAQDEIRENVTRPSVHITLGEELASCTSLWQLTQTHSKIIMTSFLESQVFPLHWNNLIRSYTRLNVPRSAVQVYLAMVRAGISPDCYTLPIVLKAICQCYIGTGTQLHAVMMHCGLEAHEFCESGLISLYCKAGRFGDAHRVFAETAERKLGSWNAMIGGLSQGGRARDAVDMFLWMRRCGFMANDVTMVGVLVACGSLRDLGLALQLHKCVFQVKIPGKDDILMLNSLIDVYGKCGQMDIACRVFSLMDHRNVSSWTSMIVGYAMHGHAHEALQYFHNMRMSHVLPNHITFLGVLSACVHGLMVEDGKRYFHMMKNSYGIEPHIRHFGCMVDLLGRAGLLEEARTVVETMPMRPNAVIWGCLLGACERYCNVEMGEWVVKHLLELEPWNDGVYVVISNIYASRNMWEKVGRIRVLMKQSSLAKNPGSSAQVEFYPRDRVSDLQSLPSSLSCEHEAFTDPAACGGKSV
ncbi:hypothetical protein Droror1_Dr00001196 [Drosera rotundifolia]